MKPFFSLILPCYNRSEEFFVRMLDSILVQEFTDFELLIIDNASDKIDIPLILKRYKDDRIVYYRQSISVLMGANWTTGVELAKGIWTTIVHDDDYMYPTHLSKIYDVIKMNPSIKFVYTTPEVFYKVSNEKKYDINNLPFQENIPINGKEILKSCIKYNYVFIAAPCVTIESNILKKNLPFSTFPVLSADLNMWFRVLLTKNVTFSHIRSYTYQYVMHSNQLSAQYNWGQIKIHYEYFKHVFSLPPKYWLIWFKHLLMSVVIKGFKNMIRRLR